MKLGTIIGGMALGFVLSYSTRFMIGENPIMHIAFIYGILGVLIWKASEN